MNILFYDIILTALNNKRRGVSMQEKVKLNNGLSKFKESLNKKCFNKTRFLHIYSYSHSFKRSTFF